MLDGGVGWKRSADPDEIASNAFLIMAFAESCCLRAPSTWSRTTFMMSSVTAVWHSTLQWPGFSGASGCSLDIQGFTCPVFETHRTMRTLRDTPANIATIKGCSNSIASTHLGVVNRNSRKSGLVLCSYTRPGFPVTRTIASSSDAVESPRQFDAKTDTMTPVWRSRFHSARERGLYRRFRSLMGGSVRSGILDLVTGRSAAKQTHYMCQVYNSIR